MTSSLGCEPACQSLRWRGIVPTELNLLPSDGEAYLVNDALSPAEADRYLDLLRDRIDWRQESVRLMGRSIQIPRLSAWYGTAGYRYSGIMHALQPLTEELQELQAVVEDLAGLSFNGVLLNLYRDGQDSVGWHADNEPSLGPEPVIASLSLGAARRFQLKHRTDRTGRVTLDLPHGSCLVMRGKTQQCWLHQLPKTRAPVGPRINLTFRRMVGELSAVSLVD